MHTAASTLELRRRALAPTASAPGLRSAAGTQRQISRRRSRLGMCRCDCAISVPSRTSHAHDTPGRAQLVRPHGPSLRVPTQRASTRVQPAACVGTPPAPPPPGPGPVTVYMCEPGRCRPNTPLPTTRRHVTASPRLPSWRRSVEARLQLSATAWSVQPAYMRGGSHLRLSTPPPPSGSPAPTPATPQQHKGGQ